MLVHMSRVRKSTQYLTNKLVIQHFIYIYIYIYSLNSFWLFKIAQTHTQSLVAAIVLCKTDCEHLFKMLGSRLKSENVANLAPVRFFFVCVCVWNGSCMIHSLFNDKSVVFLAPGYIFYRLTHFFEFSSACLYCAYINAL